MISNDAYERRLYSNPQTIPHSETLEDKGFLDKAGQIPDSSMSESLIRGSFDFRTAMCQGGSTASCIPQVVMPLPEIQMEICIFGKKVNF